METRGVGPAAKLFAALGLALLLALSVPGCYVHEEVPTGPEHEEYGDEGYAPAQGGEQEEEQHEGDEDPGGHVQGQQPDESR